MKVYLVSKLTFFGGNPWIDSFHYTMFHGMAEPRNPGGNAPLLLTLNAHRINEVIEPEISLVVSQGVADLLRDLPRVELREVTLTKVVDVAYREGDFSHWDDPDYFDDGEGPDRVLSQASEKAGLRHQIPNYYELIIPRFYDIDWETPDAERIAIKIGPTEWDDVFEEKVSTVLLERYPIVWHMTGILFNEKAFGRIEKYLNRDYFLLGSAELPTRPV